jgi:hypothetical protein
LDFPFFGWFAAFWLHFDSINESVPLLPGESQDVPPPARRWTSYYIFPRNLFLCPFHFESLTHIRWKKIVFIIFAFPHRWSWMGSDAARNIQPQWTRYTSLDEP